MKNRIVFLPIILSLIIHTHVQSMDKPSAVPNISAPLPSPNSISKPDTESEKEFSDEIASNIPYAQVLQEALENFTHSQVAQKQRLDTKTIFEQAQSNASSFHTNRAPSMQDIKQGWEQQTKQNTPFTPNADKALCAQALKNCPALLKQALYAVQQGKNFKSLKRFLLVGPSGTGKTTIAEAIAAEYGMPLLFYRGDFIANTFQNGGNQNLKIMFQEAIEKQPCVLVIDELNALFEKHEKAQDGDSGIVRALWSMIDECEKHNVIFIGTFNCVKELPPQIKTRFPAIFRIDFPTESERAQALGFHITHHIKTNNIIFDSINLNKIAQNTRNFSLREIASLIDQVSLQAFFANNKRAVVTTNDILKIIPDIKKRSDGAIDKKSWTETLKIAAHYGFQVATIIGQMYFQKWMLDRQFTHAHSLHADGQFFQAKMQSEAHSFQNNLHTDGQSLQIRLQTEGQAFQNQSAEKQNSVQTVAKNSLVSSVTNAAVQGAVDVAKKILSPVPTAITNKCSIQ